jgi:hypothetical protein
MAGPSTFLYARENVLSDQHIAFYAERARGGAGLIVTEEQGAYRLGVGAFAASCSAWTDAAVPQLAKLANAAHAHGAKVSRSCTLPVSPIAAASASTGIPCGARPSRHRPRILARPGTEVRHRAPRARAGCPGGASRSVSRSRFRSLLAI